MVLTKSPQRTKHTDLTLIVKHWQQLSWS